MPKETLNINDFSGGLNTSTNPRDIEVNQAQQIDGLMSYKAGSLQSQGGFIRPVGFSDTTGGFKEEYIHLGINNLYGVQPEYSFRIVNRAAVSVSGTTATFTTTGDHGLSTGTKILVFHTSLNASDGWLGRQVSPITKTGATTFTGPVPSGSTSSIDVSYAVGATYQDSNFPYKRIRSKQQVNFNMYLLKASQMGKFGFYCVGQNKMWYGSNSITENHFGGNNYFFDTKNLWDWDQKEYHEVGSGLNDGLPISSLPVYDAFYSHGAVRILTEPQGKWNNNTCRRPVNLTYIPEKRYFGSDYGSYHILEGWYPLRSHILSPNEYMNPIDDSYYTTPGTLSSSFSSTSLSAFDSDLDKPQGLKAYQTSIAIGHGGNVTNGDWQFDSGSGKKIKLGISYVYDSMEVGLQQNSAISEFSQEITMGDGAANVGEDNRALYLAIQVHRGSTLSSMPAAVQTWGTFDGDEGSVAIPELRGTGVNSDDGRSNFKAWNPRIVGINIWLTGDNEGPLSDPAFLAGVPFETGKFGTAVGGSKSSTSWSNAHIMPGPDKLYSSMMFIIPTVPSLGYTAYTNGIKYDENRSVWYKTAAVVNGKLFAGNVSYFDHRPQDSPTLNNNTRIKNFPDRILISPEFRFDMLSPSSYVPVMDQDGQSIVKLVGFNSELLVFKNNDLFVYDVSSAEAVLVRTFMGKGVNYASQVFKSTEFVFWCNIDGVFAYSGGGANAQIIDLVSNLDVSKWRDLFCNYSHPVYDPQNNLLIIFSKKAGEINNDRRALIINMKTGALYFKSTPTEFGTQNHSGGVIMNNSLYVTGFVPGQDNDDDGTIDQDSGEEFFGDTTTDHESGEHSGGMISFQFANTDSAANKNVPSANTRYMFVRQGTSWRTMNSTAFNTDASVNSKRAAQNFIKDANRKVMDNAKYFVSFDYNEDTEFFTASIRAREKGTAYNTSPTAITGDSGSVYGNTGVAFGSGTADSSIAVGNIENFSQSGLKDGSNFVPGVVRIKVDRNSKTKAGVSYILTLNRSVSVDKKGEAQDYNYQWIYVTGESSSYIAAASSNYEDETDASVTDDVRNDRLLTNIHEFLQYNSPLTSNGLSDFLLKDSFTFGSITGISGGKYFDLTANSSTESDMDDFDMETETYSGSGGEILKWDNTTLKIFNPDLQYITPDIDFNEPNVRKKVYKGYITYKDFGVSGNGEVAIYYKANQGASWTKVTTTDTTTSGHLDSNKTNWYRQEFSFGTGGNNIYSFALKLQAESPIKTFVINDISLIYRIKKPK